MAFAVFALKNAIALVPSYIGTRVHGFAVLGYKMLLKRPTKVPLPMPAPLV